MNAILGNWCNYRGQPAVCLGSGSSEVAFQRRCAGGGPEGCVDAGQAHEGLRGPLDRGTHALCSWDYFALLKIMEDHKELIYVGYI